MRAKAGGVPQPKALPERTLVFHRREGVLGDQVDLGLAEILPDGKRPGDGPPCSEMATPNEGYQLQHCSPSTSRSDTGLDLRMSQRITFLCKTKILEEGLM